MEITAIKVILFSIVLSLCLVFPLATLYARIEYISRHEKKLVAEQ